MIIGAGALVRAWGRDMVFKRDGNVLLHFKGRLAEFRPFEEPIMESVDQNKYIVIAVAADFGSIRPHKYDIIIYEDEEYTVHRGHTAGAEEVELLKMIVFGGIV